MHCAYKDITSKLGKPLWWDERAVPRYSAFSPEDVANIYAREVALVEISCQHCDFRFPVAFSWSSSEMANGMPFPSISERIIKKEIQYRDPPNYSDGCCPSGACSMSNPVKVLEFWKYGKSPSDWTRLTNLEVAL